MQLPTPIDTDVSGKRVLLRLDLDLPQDGDDTRLADSKETLEFLINNNSKIVVIAHKGKPEGKVQEAMSLKPITEKISALTGKEFVFKDSFEAQITEDFVLMENLRFNPGEEENDPEFAKKLSSLGDYYINEAFATSHRNHASIVGVPKLLPHGFGFRFIHEIENLSKVFEDPKKPVLVLISGIKEDKIEMAKKLSGIYDKVLVGGRLPEFMGDEALVSVRLRGKDEKLIVANLNMDKEDITLHTIARFKDEIGLAGTIVLAGVLGKYEDEGHRQGTREIFQAVADSGAFKIAGGGDTEAALTMFNLTSKFDWISVGGGAMLEFLSNKTLPGIEAAS